MLFFYRLCAHIVCVGLVTLISYGLMKAKFDGISVWSLILIVFLSYCVVTYFIDIHADAAEGLQITYLLDNDLYSGRSQSPEFQVLLGDIVSK